MDIKVRRIDPTESGKFDDPTTPYGALASEGLLLYAFVERVPPDRCMDGIGALVLPRPMAVRICDDLILDQHGPMRVTNVRGPYGPGHMPEVHLKCRCDRHMAPPAADKNDALVAPINELIAAAEHHLVVLMGVTEGVLSSDATDESSGRLSRAIANARKARESAA